MKIFTALLVALAISCARAEEVYREVNDEGVPTFSDQAKPGAEPINLRQPSIFINTTYKQRQLNQKNDDSLMPTIMDYSLLVTNPPDDSVVRDNAGNLNLTISISPPVQPGHSAELLMDGTKVRDVQVNGIVALTNIDRGTHAFNVRIIDEQGNVITDGPANRISILRYHSPRKSPK